MHQTIEQCLSDFQIQVLDYYRWWEKNPQDNSEMRRMHREHYFTFLACAHILGLTETEHRRIHNESVGDVQRKSSTLNRAKHIFSIIH